MAPLSIEKNCDLVQNEKLFGGEKVDFLSFLLYKRYNISLPPVLGNKNN